MSDHLEECADCRSRLADAQYASSAAAAVDRHLEEERGAPTHLEPEQLERWTDGTDDEVEHELAKSHLAVCATCRAEAEDLARFAATAHRSDAGPWSGGWRRVGVAAALLLAVGIVVRVQGFRTPQPSAPVRQEIPGVRPTTPPKAPMLLRDGALHIDASGTIAGIPDRWHEAVAALIAKPELDLPAAVLAVARAPELQRGMTEIGAGSTRLLAPLSRVVLDPRPTFSWHGPGRASYQVEVFDSRFHRIAASGPLRGFDWRPSQALPSGELLTWKLTVTDAAGVATAYPTPPAPPAVFRVAAEEALAELEQARAADSHLLAALALWRAGLVEEAATELQALADRDPTSPLARRLVESSRRGAATLHAGDGELTAAPPH